MKYCFSDLGKAKAEQRRLLCLFRPHTRRQLCKVGCVTVFCHWISLKVCIEGYGILFNPRRRLKCLTPAGRAGILSHPWRKLKSSGKIIGLILIQLCWIVPWTGVYGKLKLRIAYMLK